jgi:pimeloyl-ACP methyl ester carboxylesterase
MGRLGRILLALVCCISIGTRLMAAQEQRKSEKPMKSRSVRFETAKVDGLSIFYREAGPEDAPTIVLLHGFPSSSRMFQPLLERLSDRYHLIAPDYPGFGKSDAPDPSTFAYTFDHIAAVMDDFVKLKGITEYSLYLQDYGGPVGFRLAIGHPERIESLIIQNAVAHEDGLGPLWATRRAYWSDRPAHEAGLRANFLSLEATRQRHLGSDPNLGRYDPDLWRDEYAFLSRPGQAQIQSDLFYDYRMNVASYPQWQRWLRETRPHMLVLWGKYDPSFQVAEVAAYQRDVPLAEVHVLDAGHFALDTDADSIAARVRMFLSTKEARR